MNEGPFYERTEEEDNSVVLILWLCHIIWMLHFVIVKLHSCMICKITVSKIFLFLIQNHFLGASSKFNSYEWK